MSGPATSCGSPSEQVRSAPEAERRLHKQILLDNIDFLIDTLTAEHVRRQQHPPAGCPRATPENIARNQSKTGDPCQYHAIQRRGNESDKECPCGDPLVDSDDPLDTVATVVLGKQAISPSERFFDRVPRRTVANLRESHGTWENIATLDQEDLHEAVRAASPRKGVSTKRIECLQSLLEAVTETHYTEGTTLRGFSRVQYSTYVKFLQTIPGVEEQDAWWIVQTAFDKPVWPADPLIDELLVSLGLLDPASSLDSTGRHTDLEDELIDRQIPVLYRALATHAVNSDAGNCGENCEIRKFLLTYRLEEQRKEREGPVVVDLFAGAGGLSHGLSQAGYDVRWAIDIEPDAVATYRLNHPEIPHQNVVCGDVREIDIAAEVRNAAPDPDVIVGGPPCQSLSQAGYRSRRAKDDDYSVLDDDRTNLYTKYVEAVDELRPKAIVMENVEGMVNKVGDTDVRVIDWIIEDLKALDKNGEGYQVGFRLQDMTELGIPQERERVLLIGIRNDLVVSENEVEDLLDSLKSTDCDRTIRQGLSGLPRLRRGEGGRVLAETGRGSKSQYVKQNRLHEGTELCFNHQAREHPMEKDRILFDEGLQPGDTGWDVKYDSDGEYAEYIEYDVGTADNPRFRDKYRKLEWSKPSPTIVAHLAKDANGFVLPDYYEHARPDREHADPRRNRGITPREAARLQSFPDHYIFLGPFTSWFRQIGNAVPPVAGKIIGTALWAVFSDEIDETAPTAEQHPAAEIASDD
ncbi:DNA cytosine methyltransferase [Haloarchaeobius amylolyticus]|uniref:DNA cytosine methyltransferase n=1 Tax=Haloarchaeobius amylolyticus TaxID=1198296 RepID=UPI00226FC28A|nr:DNA cytosine methyltransferase [Haloarchaeobius amylolyticus]